MLSMLDVVEDVERFVLYANLAAGKTKRVSCFKIVKWREIISVGMRSSIHPSIHPSIHQIFVYHQIQGYRDRISSVYCRESGFRALQMFRGRSVVGRSDWQADSHGRTRLSTKHFFRTSSEHRTASGHNTYVNFTHVGGSKMQSRAMGGVFSMGTGGVADKAAWSEFQPSISRVCGRLTNPEQRRPGLRCVDSFLLLLTDGDQAAVGL
jgi:hypothetical protein